MSTADVGSEVVRLRQRTPFTMVDNPIIRQIDDYVALGMYLDMLSYPPGWRLNLREIARTHKQGRTVLTNAINDLIARGLVFRVRYQHDGGQWATRTYVCARAVSFEELDDIRQQYGGRCRIETTPELTEQLAQQSTRPATDTTPTSARGSRYPQPTGSSNAGSPPKEQPEAANALVTPKTQFPTPGSPTAGRPSIGLPMAGEPIPAEPSNGDQAPQTQESRRNIPPPVPPDHDGARTDQRNIGGGGDSSHQPDPVDSPSPHRPQRSMEHQLSTDGLSYLEMALIDAWPTLGRRDLERLRPHLRDASRAFQDEERLRVHLTTNTGGARNPASVIAARLDNLPLDRPTRRRLPVWCGQCAAEDYRWIQDQSGRPIGPCPTCSPQANSA